MVAPVIFLPESRQVLSQHGRLRVVNLETSSRDAKPLNLSPNVSKFYAWQVGSWMNEQQSQNLLLKVNYINYSQKQVEHARWENRNNQVQSFCIENYLSSLPSVKSAIYEIKLFVSRISAPLERSARYSLCFVVHVMWYINKEPSK